MLDLVLRTYNADPINGKQKKKNTFDAAFKLNGIDFAVTEGNRAAAGKLGMSESMVVNLCNVFLRFLRWLDFEKGRWTS